MIKYLCSILCFFYFGNLIYAQTANQVLMQSVKVFGGVNDFKSKVEIGFDLPSINIQKMGGNVFYRKPDQYKVKLTGVAFLPKQNPFALFQLLKDSAKYLSVMGSNSKMQGVNCYSLQVIPQNDADVVLAKLWIEVATGVLMKSEITTRSSGTVVSLYQYGKQKKYALPDKIEFQVDMRTFKLPKMIAVDLNNKRKATTQTSAIGKIAFVFSDYVINRGFADADLK